MQLLRWVPGMLLVMLVMLLVLPLSPLLTHPR